MRHDALLFIFTLGLIMLNWPLLKIFNESLPRYLFSSWFLFIILIMLSERFFRRE